MLTSEELILLESLLKRARHSAGSDRAASAETITPGDVVQLRPGTCPHWETSFLLVGKVRDNGGISGTILRPHRSGCQEAWYTYRPPEVARVGRAPFPEPGRGVKRWDYCPPCPMFAAESKPIETPLAGIQEAIKELPKEQQTALAAWIAVRYPHARYVPVEPKPIQRETRVPKRAARAVQNSGAVAPTPQNEVRVQDQQSTTTVASAATAKVSQLCDDYMALRQGAWSEGWRKTNAAMFRTIIKPAIGDRPIESITTEDLEQFVNGLPNRTFEISGKLKSGISLSYAKKIIAALRDIFDLAHERDLISKNPARSMLVRLTPPKQVRKPAQTVFPPQYLPALLAQMTTRDRLIIWLSILGATQPNELFAVRGSDVGPGWVHIERTCRQIKTALFIHLPPELASEVREWKATEGLGPRDLLFPNRDGNPVERANFLNRRLRPAAVRAKIPVLDVDFQMLRRSFATVAQFVGLNVKAIQSQRGQVRPDMTATGFIQSIDELTAGQLKRLEDIMRGREPVPVDVAATAVIQ